MFVALKGFPLCRQPLTTNTLGRFGQTFYFQCKIIKTNKEILKL